MPNWLDIFEKLGNCIFKGVQLNKYVSTYSVGDTVLSFEK